MVSSSTKPAPASRLHPASLVERSAHCPALLEVLDAKVSRNVIAYVVDQVVEAVDYAFSRPSASSSSKERGRSARRSESSFTAFATRVISNADVKMPVIIATLVYIERARRHLQIALEEWACERVFLGALIVASKYLNDSTLKNVHWAYCTGVFGKSDVGRIEREFLDVLAFELSVTEQDLMVYHEDLSRVTRIAERRRRVESDASIPPAVRRTSTSSSAGSRSSRSSAGSLPELSPPSSASSATTSNATSPATPASNGAPSHPPGISPRSRTKARSTSVRVADADAMDVDHVEDVAHTKAKAAKAAAAAPTKSKRHSAVDLLRSIPGLPYHRSHASRSPPGYRASAAAAAAQPQPGAHSTQSWF